MSNLVSVSPFFIVADIKTSVAFYVSKLGFQLLHMGPEGDPYWAMVGRGPVSIMLKAIADDIKPVPNHTRHEWAPWDAFVSVTDPDALFEEYRTAGVIFSRPIHDNTDNIRGFELADADGYRLFFGRPNA